MTNKSFPIENTTLRKNNRKFLKFNQDFGACSQDYTIICCFKDYFMKEGSCICIDKQSGPALTFLAPRVSSLRFIKKKEAMPAVALPQYCFDA